MSGRFSRVRNIFTWPRAFIAIIVVLITLIGWLTNHFAKVYVPTKIKSEVADQLPKAIETQVGIEVTRQLTPKITAQITQDIETQTQKIKVELSQQISDDNKQINLRIDGIFAIVEGSRKTLGTTLKNSVTQKPIALMRTLPAGRELLAHAKARALVAPSRDAAPIISTQDFNEITKSLFREFEDPDLNSELWHTVVEFASYKTVATGVEFGVPKPNRFSGFSVFLGDSEYKNSVFVDARIILRGGCPLDLQNVRFVNCTFDVDNEQNGKIFFKTLLMSSRPTMTLVLKPTRGYVKGACEK